MSINLINRHPNTDELGDCDSGFAFYNCNTGFVGCCSVDACDPEGCPDDDKQPAQSSSTTTSSPTSDTPISFITDASTPDQDGTSSSDPPTTIDYTSDWPAIATDTMVSLSTATDSNTPNHTSTPPSTPTSNLAPTEPPTQSAEQPPRLSTAAVAGICVGGTTLTLIVLIIAALLIRRHRIAKRMAALPAASPFADKPPDAEAFMMGHPAWRRQEGVLGDG
ncbi:hypothetical protein F4804DRAFT_308041 [Jackrogersella minutella]|nr:hypothetical protein F4804DRAFT_308041 [Jackrogersella minutella]